MPRTKKINYTYQKGRRKSASAKIRLYKGKDENLVNGQPFEKYFPGDVNKSLWMLPFKTTDTLGKYYVSVKVRGGGLKGQLGAVTHGIAKALVKEDPEKFKLSLRKAGLLTRDSRIRQRRMVGTGGKARGKKQSPKR